eukprot:2982393-Amphidinium_carterae.3
MENCKKTIFQATQGKPSLHTTSVNLNPNVPSLQASNCLDKYNSIRSYAVCTGGSLSVEASTGLVNLLANIRLTWRRALSTPCTAGIVPSQAPSRLFKQALKI